MNFLQRMARSFITILPSVLPGWLLGNYAWRMICQDMTCKAISMVLLLTAAILLLWSIIVFVVSLLETEEKEGYDVWKRFRINLLSITPNILFHAAIFGVMLYGCLLLVTSHVDTAATKESGRFFLLVILAVPIYELTRLFERKKSVEDRPEESNDVLKKKNDLLKKYTPQPASPDWKVYGGIYLQTAFTFGIWYGVLFLLLPYKSLFEGHIKETSLLVIAVMAVVSFLLLKLFKQTEKLLRARGIISWDSSYF
ncbi:hypothetical protein HB364_05920 [Pseudoflavitalea sp. X16]|uniref:hypothetical protein n=1 Tax=Paraflavitalea devenefica TaxID=2716334 RepID=UPI00141E7C0A|nr:hypothetical protein [Paraflavitalea devenefica]NII24603.1 hypothetical protein [Paraflavitalea devenefica]